MRKLVATVIMLVVALSASAVLAAFKETIPEDANITAVKRLAIALPMHYKSADAEPSVDEFTKIIFNASKISKEAVISYDEIAQNIMIDTGVDIKALQDEDSRKAYNASIAKYADSYLLVTTANNDKRTQFFFEIYDAKTGDLVYVLTTQNASVGKNSKDYTRACEEFYRQFDAAVEKTIKDAKKKSKKK